MKVSPRTLGNTMRNKTMHSARKKRTTTVLLKIKNGDDQVVASVSQSYLVEVSRVLKNEHCLLKDLPVVVIVAYLYNLGTPIEFPIQIGLKRSM